MSKWIGVLPTAKTILAVLAGVLIVLAIGWAAVYQPAHQHDTHHEHDYSNLNHTHDTGHDHHGTYADTGHDHREAYAGPHAHPYASTTHGHGGYAYRDHQHAHGLQVLSDFINSAFDPLPWGGRWACVAFEPSTGKWRTWVTATTAGSAWGAVDHASRQNNFDDVTILCFQGEAKE